MGRNLRKKNDFTKNANKIEMHILKKWINLFFSFLFLAQAVRLGIIFEVRGES